MKGRFSLVVSVLCLSACAGGGGYTRAKVVTPQTLDCGAAGLASVQVWSPEEATLTFMGKKYDMKRTEEKTVPYYKGGGAEYVNHAVFGKIRVNGTMYQCDVRPRDLEPETPVTVVPEVEQRIPRLDVSPYL